MTLQQTIEAPTTAPPRWHHFLRHGIEMIVAMAVGMMLLAPAWTAALTWTGLTAALARPDVVGLIAATNMTVAMTIWMLYRGHGKGRIIEMAAAMYVPFLVLIVPYWLGILPGEHIMTGGHLLMLPAMLIAMLVHREEYSHKHSTPSDAHPLIQVLGRRAPTWIALTMSLDNWTNPSAPAPFVMLILPLAYLFFGVVRRQFGDRRMLAIQLAGFGLYLALAIAATIVEPSIAKWIIAAGWGAHAIWDFVHHRIDRVAPRWWSEWCGVVDLVIAVTIVLFL